MINLDSILKSRNITLPTKVCLVKVMVFPLVSEATQLSPPLSPSSPLALNLSQHQALYQ